MVLKETASSSCHQGHLLPMGLKVRWSVTWANIVVPSSDVPAEVDLLYMRIERHDLLGFLQAHQYHE